MKKIIVLISILAIIPVAYLFVQSAEQYNVEVVQYTISVDGAEQKLTDLIVTINDRTYLPLRELAEVLGYDIEWREDEQLIQIKSDKQENGEGWLSFIEDQKYGYMDIDGNIKIKPQFDFVRDFVDEMCIRDS